ncbi:MAG: acyl carrier protein [Desulfobulbaceae bacterium]|nr:acyl carrier protein [Desulfobulbaceae bacterium]
MEALEQELVEMICEVCKVAGGIPGDFSPTAPLIGPESPLGIDSLDAVEIVFTIQNRYQVRIDSEDTSRQVLATLQSLAKFVRENRPEGRRV